MVSMKFIFLIIASWISAFGSLVDKRDQNELSDNFIGYYRAVNDAQYMILKDSSYGDALLSYKLAFELVESPFSQDLFNAAVCAAYIEDTITLKKYVYSLLERGFSLDFFMKNPLINSLDDSFSNQAEEEYEQLKFNLHSRIDSTVIRKVNLFVNLDQEVRSYKASNRAAFLDSIRAVDDIIANDFVSFIQVDFPGLDALGVTSLNSRHPAEIIFIHRSNIGQTDYLEILKEAALNGKYHPLYYMMNVDHYQRAVKRDEMYGSDLNYLLNDTIWCHQYDASTIEEINANRNSMGFTDLEMYKEMYGLYDPKTSPFVFIFPGAITSHNVPQSALDRVRSLFKNHGLSPCY